MLLPRQPSLGKPGLCTQNAILEKWPQFKKKEEITKQAKDLDRHFSKENIRMADNM